MDLELMQSISIEYRVSSQYIGVLICHEEYHEEH